MIVAQVACSIVLLAGAGLMGRSFLNLYVDDVGIRTRGLTAMAMSLPAAYSTPEARLAFVSTLEARLAEIDRITGVAVTTGVPPFDGGERRLEVEGSAQAVRFVSTVTVTPTFFDVAERDVIRGRRLEPRDGSAGAETVLINEELAEKFFPGVDPVGRRIRFASRRSEPGDQPDIWRTIVGIAPPILHGDSSDRYRNAVVYLPYREQSPAAFSLLIRSTWPTAVVEERVRREVQTIDRDQPVGRARTIEELAAEARQLHRVIAVLFVALAAVALLLSAMGLYAVARYSVTQRTAEIGIRLAVGAPAAQIAAVVVRGMLTPLAIGLASGGIGGVLLGTAIQRLLVDIDPIDPMTFVGIATLLAVTAAAAMSGPIRRAVRIDPLVALRTD